MGLQFGIPAVFLFGSEGKSNLSFISKLLVIDDSNASNNAY